MFGVQWSSAQMPKKRVRALKRSGLTCRKTWTEPVSVLLPAQRTRPGNNNNHWVTLFTGQKDPPAMSSESITAESFKLVSIGNDGCFTHSSISVLPDGTFNWKYYIREWWSGHPRCSYTLSATFQHSAEPDVSLHART